MNSDITTANNQVLTLAPGSELDLNDDSSVWIVESGSADVFTVQFEDVPISYQHVCHVTKGALLFGIHPHESAEQGIRVKTSSGCRIKSVQYNALLSSIAAETIAERIDEWVLGLTNKIVREIESVPIPDIWVDTSNRIDTQMGSVVAARHGVAWVPVSTNCLFLGTISSAAAYLPVTRQSWFNWSAAETIDAVSTIDLVDRNTCAQNLRDFHQVTLEIMRETRTLMFAELAILQRERSALRREEETKARQALHELATGEVGPSDSDSLLLEALEKLGRYEQIVFEAPRTRGERGSGLRLDQILLASNVRARSVHLPDDETWWFGDKGALLARNKLDDSPVALIPSQFGRYKYVDPRANKKGRLTKAKARQLASKAWAFYCPFPENRLRIKDIVRMVAAGSVPGLLRYSIAGLLVGLITFVPALFLGIVTDLVVSRHDLSLIPIVITAIVFLGLLGGMTFLYQTVSLLRLEGRGEVRATAALWNRLFEMQSRERGDYMAGDLASRAMTFEKIRVAVSGTISNTLTSLLFLLPAIVALMVFDPMLASVVLGLGLLTMVVLVAVSLIQLKWQSQVAEIRQKLTGSLYEFVSAMRRIQKAGATGSVFAAWTRPYCDMKRTEMKSNSLDALTMAISAGAPSIAGAMLLVIFALGATSEVSIGQFLAVYAASLIFFTAITRLGTSLSSVTNVVPVYRQASPLLNATSENDDQQIRKFIPTQLSGYIQVDHVSFRYAADGPLILDDVSLQCSPGEFVAIVGDSGSGKSTLFKLMLGLEVPDSGAVYYDQQNLASFNLAAIRQQIGVVMQRSTLIPGSLLQNIIGVNTELTIDDAWRAAESAALSDDITNMPMGMYTEVGDDYTLFSGGQSQKILIAGALVTRPRVLFLDEATNWLDNASQAQVVASIDRIAATRIVIAHRLATIRDADRIYVMSGGRVVQEGTFKELARVEGKFRNLVARQTL